LLRPIIRLGGFIMMRFTPLLIVCMPLAASAQMLEPAVVARTGDSVPEVPGATFVSLTELPRLGTNGHVAFQGQITGGGTVSSNDIGFWAGTIGNLNLVARENTSVAGGIINWSGTVNLGVDENGEVSMWTAQNLPSTEDQRMWSYLPNGNGGNTLVAAEGTTSPPGFTGAVFSAIGAGQASNNSGAVAFVGSATGGDATFASDQALFTGTPGNLKLVAREGSPAPGATGTAPVFSTTFTPIFDKRINAFGQVAFGAALSGSGVAPGNDRATYIWTPDGGNGTLTLAAQTGNTAPGLGSPTIRYSTFDDSPGFNDTGQVAFRAFLIGEPSDGLNLINNIAIFAGAPGEVQLIARSGSPSPIAGLQYRAMDQYPRINEDGQVAFISLLGPSVPTTSDRVLWLTTPAGTVPVAREGDPAPGASLDDSVLFNALEAVPPVVNNAGQVAFTATLTGPGISSTNDRGLWAGAPGSLSLIAREGDVVDVDPGPGVVNRTISTFSFANGFTVSGGTNFSSADDAFNDAGQIAWRALFVGGESAIFLTTLTSEPPGLDGDFNHDGSVDAADYVVWRKGVGVETTEDNYNIWRTNFGRTAGGGAAANVPEPSAAALVLLVLAAIRRPDACRATRANAF
jgi:hypothetical protein